MLNYDFYWGQLIIMLKKHHVINDDFGLDFYNLKNPTKWHNVISKYFTKKDG